MSALTDKIRGALGAAIDRTAGTQIRRAAAALEPYRAQVRARYQKLESREKLLLKIAGGVFALFLAYNFIYFPIQSYQEGIQTRIETRQRELKEVNHLVATYLQRQSDLRTAEKNTVPISKDFSLFSVVEKALTQSVGHDKIGSITPGADRKLSDGFTQFSVELKLQNVTLAQVVDALYGIRTMSEPVAVASLRMTRRTQDPHSYDVDMTCVALAKNG